MVAYDKPIEAEKKQSRKNQHFDFQKRKKQPKKRKVRKAFFTVEETLSILQKHVCNFNHKKTPTRPLGSL